MNDKLTEQFKVEETTKPSDQTESEYTLRGTAVFCYRLQRLHKIVAKLDLRPLTQLSKYIDTYLAERNKVELLSNRFTDKYYGAPFDTMRYEVKHKIIELINKHAEITGSITLMYDLFDMYGV